MTTFHRFLLCFTAGHINASGFMATGRFVSHVTGFATLFGIDMANQKYGDALGIISVPVFFLLGSFLAGLLIDRPVSLQQRPRFDLVMGLSALCLFISALGGVTIPMYLLLILLCMACGLQNGTIGSYRTTHLTGLVTDLGLGLARLTNCSSHEQFIKEKKDNQLRAGAILIFTLGSVIGALMFIKIGHMGFFFSGLMASYAAWEGRKF